MQTSLSSLHRISRNSLLIFIAKFFDIIGQFVVIYYISRYLGPGQYGDYGVVMVITILAGSLTYSGIERIMTREISRNPQSANLYLGGGIFVRWIYMLIVFFIMTLIIFIIDLPSELTKGIYIATLSVNLSAETLIYLAMFRAFEKMKYETYLTFLFQFFNILFIFFVVHFNLGFLNLFVGSLVANFIRTFLSIIISSKNFVKPTFSVNLKMIKLIIQESWTLSFFTLALGVFFNTDIIILKYLATTFDISMFYSPHNLIIMLTVVPISIMSAFFPTLSRAALDSKTLVFQYKKFFKFLTLYSVFASMIFIVLSQKIILTLYGKDFLPALSSFMILGASLIFTTLFIIFDLTLVVVNKQHLLIICPLIGIAIKLIFDFLLIPSYGHVGASIAAVIGYLVFFTSGFVITSNYVGSLSVNKFILKPVLVVVLIGFCLYKVNGESLFALIFLTITSFIIYILSLLKINFFLPDEIKLFKSLMQKTLLAMRRSTY